MRRVPGEKRVDRHAHVQVDPPVPDVHHLDGGAERGRTLALQHRLLYPPAPSLVVAQSHAHDPAHQVVQSGFFSRFSSV